MFKLSLGFIGIVAAGAYLFLSGFGNLAGQWSELVLKVMGF